MNRALSVLLASSTSILSIAVDIKADPLDRWAPRDLPDVGPTFPAGVFTMTGFASGNDVLVCVGQAGDFGTIARSADGIEWTVCRPIPTDPRFMFSALRSVAFGGGTFVAVGWSQSIYSSTNGIDWVRRMGELFGGLFQDVVFGDGKFVAVGEARGTNVFTSTDGSEWVGVPTPGDLVEVSRIAHGNGRFVAVGSSGVVTTPRILMSTNGVDWTEVDTGVPPTVLRQIRFGNGTFVAVGSSLTDNQWRSSLMRSSDGINWSHRLFDPDDALALVSFHADTFIGVGFSAEVFTSADGETWQKRSVVLPENLRFIGFGRNSVFVGGAGGTLLQSDPVLDLSMREFPTLTVTGLMQRTCRVEATEDLSDEWQLVATIVLSGQPDLWTDSSASVHRKRFYRAVLGE